MWNCELKEVRERRNRWNIEGICVNPVEDEKMPFLLTVRFGWLTFEGIAGPIFNHVFQHLSGILGEPKEPPTCGGSSECQDDAVHLTTSWEIGEKNTSSLALLSKLLRVSEEALSGNQLADTRA